MEYTSQTLQKAMNTEFDLYYPNDLGSIGKQVIISFKNNGRLQLRDFESFTHLSGEQAVEVIKKVIDNTSFKSGEANLFYSGYAGWVLMDDWGEKIGYLMYNRENKTWYFTDNYSTATPFKDEINPVLDEINGYDKLNEKDKEILHHIQRYYSSSITREMRDYIYSNYKKITNKGDAVWYKVWVEGNDSKYGAFMISPSSHQYRSCDIAEFGDYD